MVSRTTAATETVILAGARTPFGRLQGALAGFSGTDLGGLAIRAALQRSGVGGDQIDYVIMGQVLQAGGGQITARQAAVGGGIPMSVPALTVNKVCLSGLDSIALADQLIRAGEFDIVVAGGMESMTQAPHLLPAMRSGVKSGDTTVIDSMNYDGLWDIFTDQGMGPLTDGLNGPLGLGREEQDAFAARSHQLAALAQDNGHFDAELVPVEVVGRRGDTTVVDADEGLRRDTTPETLSRLRPAFPDAEGAGTITAGTASQISDGACAVVVTSREIAERRGLPWLATIGAHGVVAGPDSSLHSQPSRAIEAAAAKADLDPAGFDLYEINEAFAAVALQSMRDLKLAEDRVNVSGGAIALGHPIGASGARLVLHLAHELRRRGGGTGAAALCGGGGQGDALLVGVPETAR